MEATNLVYERHPNPAAQALLNAARKRKTPEEQAEELVTPRQGHSKKPTQDLKTKRLKKERTKTMQECMKIIHTDAGQVEGLYQLLLADPKVVCRFFHLTQKFKTF
jgi:hypothetical protein